MNSISWLHLTDLHVGMRDQDWLLPNFRENLFEDLRRLHDLAGPWDFVIFSGDVAQTGAREEFDKATEVVDGLWAHLRVLGSTPFLIVTPGNHDLLRPPIIDPTLRAMVHWHEDSQVREEFWSTVSSPYRQLINSAFGNFSHWYKQLALPKPPNLLPGALPGDSSCVIEKTGLRVGLVSLNTSFLQLTHEPFEKRLDLDVRQLVSACGGDHVKWMSGLDVALLQTHHPRQWLHPSVQARFDSEIYPPGRFFVHFCGHLHEAAALNFSIGGSALRRLRQGPSLFGLEHWGDKQKRIHGYSAGRLNVTSTEITETIWPRLAQPGYAGHLRLAADTGYDLNDNGAVVWSYSKASEDGDKDTSRSAPNRDAPTHLGEERGRTVLMLEELSESGARAALDRVPRMQFQLEPHHRRIRRVEQATCEQHLQAQRCVWILSDWGLATDSFVASVVASLSARAGIRELDAFAIQCDEASNIEAFRGQAHRQLGLPLQQFLSLAASLPNGVLVLENVPTDLLEDRMPDSGATFDDVIRSILDYCPEMRIILTTRSTPPGRLPYIVLRALELPEIRTYVLHHRNGGEKLAEPDAVDTLYRRSAGLPIHLDRLLESLRYMTLHELSDSELENSLQSEPAEAVPRDLERAVASLAQSQNRSSRRSFNLLKVLIVLPDGETLQRIKHFDQYEPFFPANATQLETLQLIQTLSLADANPTSAQDNSGSMMSETEKLLVAPRQVRDYVRHTIHPTEYSEIIKRAADIVFGGEWRHGKLKNAYFTTPGIGQRNERIILKHLLQDAIAQNDASMINRAGNLAAGVCEGLDRKNRYRETIAIAEAVLPLLQGPPSKQSNLDVASTNAKALRMLDHPDDAIEIIERVLSEDETLLSKDKKSTLYLNLALAHQNKSNPEGTVEAARKVHEVSREGSANYLQAEAIIAQQTLTGHELVTEWTRLEKIARANNCTVVANNIALDLARAVGGDEADQLRERVIKSQGDDYNHIRGVIAKVKSQLDRQHGSAILSRQDRVLLTQAYSYLYRQRMASLFDTCHEVLWQVLRSEGLWRAVLRLFRHSSFVWRIYGKLSNERKYVKELSELSLDALRPGGLASADIAYFEGRRLETSEVVAT